MEILSIIFPIVAIVGIGFLYGRKFSPDMGAANGVMLRIFVPALVFDVLSSSEFRVLDYSWLALGACAVVVGSGLLAWPVSRLAGFQSRSFVPCMMFNNCGNIGLPIAVLAFGEPALQAAVVLFLVSNLLHFTLGVYIFGGGISWREALLNPVNISTLAALVVNLAGISVPDMISYPVSLLGQIVIPLMLFSLGVRMVQTGREHLRIGVIGGLLRPATGILAALAFLTIFPLDAFQAGLLIIFSALPPAVLNFLFAERYTDDPQMVASMVVISHLLAIATLPVVLWWVL